MNKSFNRSICQIEEFKTTVDDFNIPIIVEGIKDKNVLSKLGLSNIFDISGKSVERIIQTFIFSKPEAVAILTDFDDEGKRQFKILSKHFQHQGIKVDNNLRKKIRHIFRIQKIEELNFFVKAIEEYS